MSKILAVGVATIDIISTLKSYPREDEELLADNQVIRRGGNATNSLAVLSQMGHQCSWGGIIANDVYSNVIREDLARWDIAMEWVVRSDQSTSPVSCITLNEQTGSRTIVHYRDLPEYSFCDFATINLSDFDWLHFEGRNIEQTLMMLKLLRSSCDIPISIEIEKPRDNIDNLYSFADILLFSRVFVLHHGYDDAQSFLKAMHLRYPKKELYCAWGEVGAYAIDHDGILYFTESPMCGHVVDTIGAGDVFNAAIINATIKKLSLPDCLNSACQLATKKCGQYGFNGLLDN